MPRKMRRTFCCPSDGEHDDGEGDDDVKDLPHDGVWGERVNPRARDESQLETFPQLPVGGLSSQTQLPPLRPSPYLFCYLRPCGPNLQADSEDPC
jgi:hypothetical protein